jgi:hypothetical protein
MSFELNGNLLSGEFYKFDNDIVDLTEDDYKRIIDNKKTIKIQFPYGINGIMSDIHEYSIDKFNVCTLINIINDFYNSQLSEEEKDIIYTQSDELGDDLGDLDIRKDIITYTNQCFLEEIEYENGVYRLRVGS